MRAGRRSITTLCFLLSRHLLPNRQVAEGARPMLGPVMDGLGFEFIQSGVPVASIVLERFKARLAASCIKIATRKEHSSGVYSFFERNVWTDIEPDTEAGGRLKTRSSTAKLSNSNVMRRPVLAIGIPFLR